MLRWESKCLTFTMPWLCWGTVESKITHWPLNNLFTSAVMEGKRFFCARGQMWTCSGTRLHRCGSQASTCPSNMRESSGVRQCYIYTTSCWIKNRGGCPGCSLNPDSPSVLQMRQNVDTMAHWNRRNAAVIGNSSAGLLCGDRQHTVRAEQKYFMVGKRNTGWSGTFVIKVQ